MGKAVQTARQKEAECAGQDWGVLLSFNSESVALILAEMEPGPGLENLGTGPLRVSLMEFSACLFGEH